MKIEPETLAKILQSLTITNEIEIGCEDCYEEIDQFVEMLQEGKDPAKVMPLVQHHLDICACCHEEFDALVAALEAGEDKDS
jgi:hypothetical protein